MDMLNIPYSLDTNYSFPIRKEPVYLKDGRVVDKIAIIRNDTDQVLGVVGEKYELVNHVELVDKCESALSKLAKFNRSKVAVTKNGARMYIKYEFPEFSMPVYYKGTHDMVNLTLTLMNSYDESMRFGFWLGAFRLVCSNGLTIGQDVLSLRHKHTVGLELDEILNNAKFGVEYFQNIVLPGFNKLASTPIDAVKPFMDVLVKKKVPQKMVQKIQEDNNYSDGVSQWEMYNGFTYELTHNYKGSEDRREELGKVVAKAFGI